MYPYPFPISVWNLNCILLVSTLFADAFSGADHFSMPHTSMWHFFVRMIKGLKVYTLNQDMHFVQNTGKIVALCPKWTTTNKKEV